MKKKKLLLGIFLVLILTLCLLLISQTGNQKPGFEAVILSIDGNTVTAEVTADQIHFPYRGLGDIMVFEVVDVPMAPGDRISGLYHSGSVDGDYVGLLSYQLVPSP